MCLLIPSDDRADDPSLDIHNSTTNSTKTSMLYCSDSQWDLSSCRCWNWSGSWGLQDQPVTILKYLKTICGRSKPVMWEMCGLNLYFEINQLKLVILQWKSSGEWSDTRSTGLKGFLLCLAIVDTLLEALSDMTSVTEKHGYCFRGEEF